MEQNLRTRVFFKNNKERNRNDFIMRFIRFDKKNEKSQPALQINKFAMIFYRFIKILIDM